MSLKPFLGILRVKIQTKLKENNEIKSMHNKPTDFVMRYYDEGYRQGLDEVLLLIDEAEENLQEE